VSFRLYGHKIYEALTNSKALRGNGSHGRGNERSAPPGKEQTEPNPTDRAKRGVKRSVLVEGHDIPLGVAVDAANSNDAQDGPSDIGKYSYRSYRLYCYYLPGYGLIEIGSWL
jgi:hypothetical protein